MAVNLNNAKAILYDTGWTPIEETTSDANGNFSFTNIPDGDYYIEFAVWPYSGSPVYSGGYYKSGETGNLTNDPLLADVVTISGGNAVGGIDVILPVYPV